MSGWNQKRSLNVLSQLKAFGVSEVVICPGGRNAPFVDVLSKLSDFKVHSHFEEREASFYALGLIKATGRPVAVITTSGTAVAEVLPAVTEAFYSGLPLVLISCDRPLGYRFSGAPQAMDQTQYFDGLLASKLVDVHEVNEVPALELSLNGPHVINLCFDEPLIDGVECPALNDVDFKRVLVEQRPGTALLPSGLKPVVIFSQMSPSEAEQVAEVFRDYNGLAYIEAGSQLVGRLSNATRLRHTQQIEAMMSDVDCVVRIGGVPTLKFWRLLESKYSQLPVSSFSRMAFSGLARSPQPAQALSALLSDEFKVWLGSVTPPVCSSDLDLEDLYAAYPLAEPSLVHQISKSMGRFDRLFLGNSMAIREWDEFATSSPCDVHANRGVNGIDGLISTSVGLCKDGASVFSLIGDLSAMYGLSGFWPLTKQDLFCLAVINNRGGKIFERLFKNPAFYNGHNYRFSDLAKFWRLDYAEYVPGSEIQINGPTLLEVTVDDQQTSDFWEELKQRFH